MKDTILWVEDRPRTIAAQIIYCREQGYRVITVGTSQRFAEELQEHRDDIALIVMDIMLYSVSSLENIGIKHSPTKSGVDAGWIIVNRVLRPEEEDGKGYFNIPILILSAKIRGENEDRELKTLKLRGGEWIRYLEKGGIDATGGATWDQEFRTIIEGLRS